MFDNSIQLPDSDYAKYRQNENISNYLNTNVVEFIMVLLIIILGLTFISMYFYSNGLRIKDFFVSLRGKIGGPSLSKPSPIIIRPNTQVKKINLS